ncbi:S8 family peptidase [Prosthecobacter dejongeii]|uniref:Thermitase n=1 Tax=Prosthecobacter dejongeii TaxID=48465 RepID=A0A7W8DSJ8_9BACT|nr:S8 family serine peptidase [Prosthecobacter dejongeii]MBB5040400.1 thermitase [Prosthecobacter dejongeii]
MNVWLKSLLSLSILVCVLSFGTLGWLAVKTTEGPSARSAKKLPDWERTLPPSLLKSLDVDARLEQTATMALHTLDELAERLRKLSSAPGVKPNELVLTFKSPEALKAFRERAAREGFQILHDDPRLLSARVKYTDPLTMARELRQNAEDLQNIGLNYLAWVPGLPDASQVDSANAGGATPFGNSGLNAIGAMGDRSAWGAGTKVAVLDTGVTQHPSLQDSRVTHIDLVKDGLEPNGHGTAMASLIAGTDARDGGVAPASDLLDIRVADTRGESNTALVAEGIMRAVDEGARLINISLGTTGDSDVLRRAVEYALANDVIVVAAAGNEQQTSLAYPAGYEGVISVAAVDANGNQAYFSNSGETLTISAPGVGIVSAYSGNRMVVSSGTSQATALTSGVISALLSWGYPVQGMAKTLTANAQPTGAPKSQVGAGIIQMVQP